ncbi:unnamed protein product [Penicillium salamii]|uniref:Serine-rich protein n=1 Tax=Penicillium salamii TaxID=1612424 RepID=A0A9W4IHN3_9EURO|nr:unnamed protein product [Penicillium salamii]CAG7965308.1 unnamed protein product [Penicillium salamii]CAG8019303.1 unnamed protein product [Penicillium salamii]CAG8088298.1 unnamed protein product [Penicillium salamii]CAG8105245.1 unnamed protein product [Penicillium salamii]
MSAPRSTSPPRARRALQERTSAHNNERSPTRSLRMVSADHEEVDQEEVNMYTATPFPTKPEQILLPIPGKGQQEYISDTGFSYSDHIGPSSSTYSSPTFSHPTPASPRDLSIGEGWDRSTVDAGNSPPEMWDDDPNSSKSSLPGLPSGKAPNYGSEGSEPEFSDDDMAVLPTATPTIKAVLSDYSMSPKSSDESIAGYSSPNIEQIGAPSSPNFVTLDNSSMHFPRPHSASSETPRSNSISSFNSRGTVVRHAGATPWFQTTFQTVSSDRLSYRTPSYQSSPPVQSVASFRSSSRAPSGPRSRSATSSSRSLRSASDLQAAIDNGVPIQYPRIRGPSSSSSRADTSVSGDRDFSPGPASGRCNPHLASGRWNPHLSTVSSDWSADDLVNLSAQPGPQSDSDRSMAEITPPPAAALKKEDTRSSVWLVESSTDSDDERLDSLTKLPSRPIFAQSLSSGSKRSNSTRSTRPGTGSSNIFNILPTWAKVYYLHEPMGLNSTLTMIDGSRPSSARAPSTKAPSTQAPSIRAPSIRAPSTRTGTSNSSVFNLVPGPLNVPRPRSPEQTGTSQRPVSPLPQHRRLQSDMRDPRAHWVPSPQPSDGGSSNANHRLHHSWSPHLLPDRRVLQGSRSGWRAPSLDSRSEPTFGRRNIQVYSFCVGFIFPLAWCIAAFLPLPPRPTLSPEMAECGSESDVEAALEMQCMNIQQRRHDNARWWRNLNRWMISLGVIIIVIVITLAVIGTTTGF